MKKVIAFLLIALLALTAIACGKAGKKEKNVLLGTWMSAYDSLVFQENGDGAWGERSDEGQPFRYEKLRYTVDGDKLTFDYGGEDTEEYTFRIEGDKLILKSDSGEATFTRQ